jgi:hypothetical protein
MVDSFEEARQRRLTKAREFLGLLGEVDISVPTTGRVRERAELQSSSPPARWEKPSPASTVLVVPAPLRRQRRAAKKGAFYSVDDSVGACDCHRCECSDPG